MKKKDVVIIGSGPAGMAVADSLYDLGIRDIVILEREKRMGGVLHQCIHDGFGLTLFGSNITGPEYSRIFEERMEQKEIDVRLATTVMDITGERIVRAASPDGSELIKAGAVVIAAGCRERSRGNIMIPGSRAAGVYTAGTAQTFINLKNLMPGKRAVIVGSGDIGLIMARRLTLEGCEVVCVVEKDHVPGGLKRNIKQCLTDYGIPMMLDSTISNIYGGGRVSGVEIRDNAGNTKKVNCDTVIISAGLIPDNTVIRTDEKDGIFLCGNALYVHGLADDVSLSGTKVAAEVKNWLDSGASSIYDLGHMEKLRLENAQQLREKRRELAEPHGETITCILCPRGCEIDSGLNGGKCPKGAAYAAEERTSPRRTVTSSVRTGSGKLAAVKTTDRIPAGMMRQAIEAIRQMTADEHLEAGAVLQKNFLGTGTDLIITRAAE